MPNPSILRKQQYFHSSSHLFKVTPFLLADIGEGIAECEIIQWLVVKTPVIPFSNYTPFLTDLLLFYLCEQGS